MGSLPPPPGSQKVWVRGQAGPPLPRGGVLKRSLTGTENFATRCEPVVCTFLNLPSRVALPIAAEATAAKAPPAAGGGRSRGVKAKPHLCLVFPPPFSFLITPTLVGSDILPDLGGEGTIISNGRNLITPSKNKAQVFCFGSFPPASQVGVLFWGIFF